jgi:hypothetical protein
MNTFCYFVKRGGEGYWDDVIEVCKQIIKMKNKYLRRIRVRMGLSSS